MCVYKYICLYIEENLCKLMKISELYNDPIEEQGRRWIVISLFYKESSYKKTTC